MNINNISKVLLIVITIAASSFFSGSAVAQDFQVFALRYRHSQESTTIIEHLNTPEGRAIVSAVAIYYGVSPEYTSSAMALISAAAVRGGGGGTRRFTMPVPAGYEYCTTIKGEEQSQTDRAKFALFFRDWNMNLLEWNSIAEKEGGTGRGRNWVNRDFDVVFVRPDKRHKYQCIKPANHRNNHPVMFEQLKEIIEHMTLRPRCFANNGISIKIPANIIG